MTYFLGWVIIVIIASFIVSITNRVINFILNKNFVILITTIVILKLLTEAKTISEYMFYIFILIPLTKWYFIESKI